MAKLVEDQSGTYMINQYQEHHVEDDVEQGKGDERWEKHAKTDEQPKEKWGKDAADSSRATPKTQGMNTNSNAPAPTRGNQARGPQEN